MATIGELTNGTLTITLTQVEQMTYTMLNNDAFIKYVSQWFDDRSKDTFQAGFANMSPENQATVLAMFAAP